MSLREGRERRRSFPSLLLRRAVGDERGQDLIEYALLASIIAIAGVLVLPGIADRLDDIFAAREAAVYDIWVPPDPVEP